MSKEAKLKLIQQEVAACTKCKELAETRTQTVFARGNPNAQLCLLGEAPGRDEDEQGSPFVGRAGKLLDNILAACELSQDDVYICNILKCRPPNNRRPTTCESNNCKPFLDLQLKVVDPKIIVCLGTTAAQNLLQVDTPISQLRGQWLSYGKIKVRCTFHPAFLLRSPDRKQDVWDDMQEVLSLLRSMSP